MQHKKYKSIPKTHEIRTTDYYVECGFDKLEWYVSEKIHGANFSFISAPDDSPVLHAERGDILENYQGGSDTKNFFNHMNIPATAHFDRQVKAMSKHLGKTIQVYTEFYGSGITKSPYIPYVQIPESAPDNGAYRNFIVLDIRVIEVMSNTTPDTEGQNEVSDRFLSLDELISLTSAFNLPMVAILFRGDMWSCIKYDTNFKSILAASNGIDTDAEGIVIKPVQSIYTSSGERVILKHVADKFSDVKLPAADAQLKKQKEADANKYNHDAIIISERANSVRVTNRAAGIGVGSQDRSKFGVLMEAVTTDIIDEVKRELNIDLKRDQVTKALVPFIKAFFDTTV